MPTFNLMTQFRGLNLTLKMELFGRKWIKVYFLNYNNSIKPYLSHIQPSTHTQSNKTLKIHSKS